MKREKSEAAGPLVSSWFLWFMPVSTQPDRRLNGQRLWTVPNRTEMFENNIHVEEGGDQLQQ